MRIRFAGTFTGTNAVAVAKTGVGTLTLTSASTYSGATTISAGTIKHRHRQRAADDDRLVGYGPQWTLNGFTQQVASVSRQRNRDRQKAAATSR